MGYSKVGHTDTWLEDSLQLLVLDNHGALRHPNWSNTNDFIPTSEQFGTVCLHSHTLHTRVHEVGGQIADHIQTKLTADQKYLCTQMGTRDKPLPVPFLPVYGPVEYAVFDRMMLVQSKGPTDFEKMALEWCDHVDGVKVFPKLPVYLRTWYNKWQHNQQVRETVGRCVSGRGRLREINSASTDTTEMTHPLPVSSGNPPVCLTHTEVRVELPPTMPKPNVSMISSYSEHTDGLVVVAGVAIGGAPVTVEKKKRGRPPKHPDDTSTATYKKRDNRVCGKCKSSGRIEAAKTCKGRGGVKFCPFVDSHDLSDSPVVPQSTSG